MYPRTDTGQNTGQNTGVGTLKLTAAKVKNAKADGKRLKLSDGRGLILIVDPGGGKYWRYRYSINGKERQLSLGKYPLMKLADARAARDEAAVLRTRGVDPMVSTKSASDGDTVKKLAKDWFDARSTNWTSQNATRVWSCINNNVLPLLGHRDPEQEVEPADILAALRQIEARGAIETARRVRGYISSIYRFGIAAGRVSRDPAADVADALQTPPETDHFAAITDPDELAQLISDIGGYRGRWYAVQPAMQLTPYLLVRPGTLRRMKWADVNLKKAEWQTRSLKGHKLETLVPLPTQAIDIIEGLQQFSGDSEFVFPGPRSPARPLSENAVLNGIRALGWGADQVTPHGFRATARTLLDETLGWRVDWIETQLGHAVKDPNGRAYNRTKFLKERRMMMQSWADYLDALGDTGRAVDPAQFGPS